MTEHKRGRGRPATIDTEKATQAVVELFRSKGYAAVSLDDLSDATGLSRPSLYRTFGNKLSMYIRAMDAFGQQVAELAVPALRADGDIEAALSDFFTAMLTIYYRDEDMTPGCLVFGTAPSSADVDAIQARLQHGIDQLDWLMRTRMQRASPACDANQLKAAVHLASNTLIAFSARAKAGAPKQELVEMGEMSARSISTLLKTGAHVS